MPAWWSCDERTEGASSMVMRQCVSLLDTGFRAAHRHDSHCGLDCSWMSPTAADPQKHCVMVLLSCALRPRLIRDAAAELSHGPEHQSSQPVDAFDCPCSNSVSALLAVMFCCRCCVLHFEWAGPHHAQLCQHEVTQTLRDEAEGQQAGSFAVWIPWSAHWAPWLPLLAGRQV